MFKREIARNEMVRSNRRWVASKTGKTTQSIHRYLNGLSMPDKSTCIAWALALNLPPMALWDEEAEAKDTPSKKTA